MGTLTSIRHFTNFRENRHNFFQMSGMPEPNTGIPLGEERAQNARSNS
jgi:hypothetical protein